RKRVTPSTIEKTARFVKQPARLATGVCQPLTPAMRGHNTPGDRSNNGAGSRGLDNSGAMTGESGSRAGRRVGDRWHLLRWLTKFARKKTTISSRNRSAMPPRNDKDTDQSSHHIDNALSDGSWGGSHEPFSAHSASRLFHRARRIAAFGLWRQQHSDL